MDIEKKFIINLQKIPENFSINENIYYGLMNIISFPFNLKILFILVIILYYYNIISPNDVFLLLSSQIIVGVIKFIIRRQRPYNTFSEIKNKELMILDYYSFPSGHSVAAFLLYFILMKKYPHLDKNIFIKILPYMVALSRVAMGVHYLTDVIMGALLAKILFTIFHKN